MEAARSEELYAFIEEYTNAYGMRNTANALILVQDSLYNAAEDFERNDDRLAYISKYKHALAVCEMLIDLHLPVPHEEEDIVLAAALCHVLTELGSFLEYSDLLMKQYLLDKSVRELVDKIREHPDMSDAEKNKFYDSIQKDRPALLVKLADRGCHVEQLYRLPIWRARAYVQETRYYYFPMCIYAKENDAQIHGVISILMEKMRSLIEVTDILSGRFQEREMTLTNEILTLQEENARIRTMIKLHGID